MLIDRALASEFRWARPTGKGFEARVGKFTDSLSHAQKEKWDRIAATAPTSFDLQRNPAIAKAIKRGEAEFALLAEARLYQQRRFNEDANNPRRAEEERLTYERLYPAVLEAFEKKHGRIIEQYWCANFAAGLVRTTGGFRLHFDGNLPEPAEVITNRCKDLAQKAREFLTGQELEYVILDFYNLLTQWLFLVDEMGAVKVPDEVWAKKRESYESRITTIELRVEQRMSRRGQRWYVGGTLIGLVALSVVLGVLAIFVSGHWKFLLEGAIFGAAGAIASVLIRMNRGALQVDASQGRPLVYIAAMVKPLTGVLFGAAVCAMALSKHFAIDVPNGTDARFYFLAVLGFAAGFSERWAPNLLELSSGKDAELQVGA